MFFPPQHACHSFRIWWISFSDSITNKLFFFLLSKKNVYMSFYVRNRVLFSVGKSATDFLFSVPVFKSVAAVALISLSQPQALLSCLDMFCAILRREENDIKVAQSAWLQQFCSICKWNELLTHFLAKVWDRYHERWRSETMMERSWEHQQRRSGDVNPPSMSFVMRKTRMFFTFFVRLKI